MTEPVQIQGSGLLTIYPLEFCSDAVMQNSAVFRHYCWACYNLQCTLLQLLLYTLDNFELDKVS